MHTVLSVNVNKIAWLRNARNGNEPNVGAASSKIIKAGAAGITVHPRPDQRHIRPDDVYELSSITSSLNVEYNIEGNPTTGSQRNGYPGFMTLVRDTRPTQCTLVPDESSQLTSDHGWNLLDSNQRDTVSHFVSELHELGCRVSIFVDADPEIVKLVHHTQADRIELFTGPWATAVANAGIYGDESAQWLAKYIEAADAAQELGLDVNAGHDLNLHNVTEFCRAVSVAEVSIGHALIADALDHGLEPVVRKYLDAIRQGCELRDGRRGRT
ncbi:MAG: pyridoxine 5'-phosphate synthase [Gammaproteobacteria bacterium]|nr:pyridoxine 5'-phosphate synthase [Gammaproteobacteria bacterium]MYI77882.1 pyridoxine 5'-phosphate synthase [Gammaproteobacteria bacterium]